MEYLYILYIYYTESI